MDKKTAQLFGAISRRAGKVIVDYDMIQEGDRVLVGVSGGKDSMALLNVMCHRQKIAPVDFEIVAVHVDSGLPGIDTQGLEQYLKDAGVPYHIERTDTFRNKDLKDLNCFWCSWNRRKALFNFAKKNGFRKIALAHHLDDISETIIMNQLFQGAVCAMCPKQEFFKGALTIIRPFAYEKEEMIARFSAGAGLNVFETCRCPVSGTGQRAAIKKFLNEMEKVFPAVKSNVFKSLRNIQEEYLP